MNLQHFLLFIFLTIHGYTYSQNNSNSDSKFNDKYYELVVKLKNGYTKIDYKSFRECLLRSKQYNVVINNKHLIDSLGYLMFKANERGDYILVKTIASVILEIDYTNMVTHQMLSKAYNSIGDSINGAKHSKIIEGLLNSIIASIDGETCRTAWSIVQITEEGFILQTLKGIVINMEINKKTLCDKFTVIKDGITRDYYFKRLNRYVK